MNFISIIGCIAFTVLGQLLVKQGAIQEKGATSFWSYATNIFILAGLLCAAFAAGSWIKALQDFNLSYAYPFMSLSFLFVAVLSVMIFGETMKMNQWIGLAIVLGGLYIGSR